MTETKQRRKPLKYTDEFKQQLADLYRFMERITVRRNRRRLPVCSQIIPQCLLVSICHALSLNHRKESH